MKSQLFYKVGLQGWNWILKKSQPCSQGWFTRLVLTSHGWKVKVGKKSDEGVKYFWEKYRGKDGGKEGHLEITASFCTQPTIFSFQTRAAGKGQDDLNRKVNNWNQKHILR